MILKIKFVKVLLSAAEQIIRLQMSMRLREIKKIKTNITSSIDVSSDDSVFSLITRELATQSSKYQYQLSIYDLKEFKKLVTTDIYQTYSQQSHKSKILNDGSTVVVATKYHIIFYDINSLEIKFKALHGQDNVYGLEASHDGKVVAMVGDNIVKMWKSANFQSVDFPFLISTARTCHFSYDNRYFGVSSTTIISIYEIQEINGNYQFITRFSTPEELQFGIISSFKFNPYNSEEIAVGFSNISPRLFKFGEGIYSTILDEAVHEEQPQYYDNYKIISYLPDGKRIISSDYSEGVGLWPGVNGRLFYKQNYLYFGVHPFDKGFRAIGYVWQQVKILEIEVKCGNQYKRKCVCQAGTIWNEAKYQCEDLACERDAFTRNGVADGNKCNCIDGYIFHDSTMQCILDCSRIKNTIANSPISTSLCYCQPGFFWRDNNCIFNCDEVIFSTGKDLGNNSCECILGWEWEKSTRSCACIAYSNKNFEGICECLAGYVFDPSQNKCVVDCQFLALENSLGVNDGQSACQCQQDFYYSVYVNENLEKVVGCRRNCTEIANSKGETIGLDSCLCEQNMDFRNELVPQCITNCSKIKNAVKSEEKFNPETNMTEVSCKCATNYLWVRQNRECGRNCTTQSYVNESRISTSLTCPCINSFEWNIFKNTCEIDCEQVNFTQSYSIQNHYSCECRQFFVWNKTDYKCKINCSQIYDAKDRIEDGRCSCKNDKKFNSSGLMCQASIAEEAFSSPWFIAVLAAGVVFIIIVACIMVRFCFRFATKENKEHNKRLKTSLDPPKPKRKKMVDEDIMREDLKSSERMKR